MVMSELELYSDAILVEYRVTSKATIDVLTGAFIQEGLLPIQMLVDMENVEM